MRTSSIKNKCIITMSDCSTEFAANHLPFHAINDIPIKHLSWKDIYHISLDSHTGSTNSEKNLLLELEEYLKRVMTMQNKESNLVYVVALSSNPIENINLSTIDILMKYNKYFCPIGGTGKGGWPKEPPNYIAFRYNGKLQSIHYIENYIETDNIHDYISDIPDKQWPDTHHFLFTLGSAIIPSKEIITGNLFRAQRVWVMLDTLLTSDTISNARDITKERLEKF